jgi:hypothetical protein
MLFLIFFFLLTGHKFDSIPDLQLVPPEPELTWDRLYVRYRWLKRMEPLNFTLILYGRHPHIKWSMPEFQGQIKKFFSKDIIEALSALEWASNDTGLVLFLFGALAESSRHDLWKHNELYFLFDKIYHNKLNAWGYYLEKIIRFFVNYIKQYKTADVLRFALRIFEKLQNKIGNIITVESLTKTIEIWKFEIIKLDMKLDDIEETNPLKEDSALSADVILLHKDLIKCYQQLKSLCGLKKPSVVLKAYYCGIFKSLAFKFALKSGDLTFLLDQEFELIIILVGCLLINDDEEIIQKNFEIVFQEPRDYFSQKNLASSVQENLFEMSKSNQGDDEKKNWHFETWVVFNGEITKSSSTDYIKLANRISHYNPKKSCSC